MNSKPLTYAVDNLSLHIQYLLLHHDCVVIPDVGAFIIAFQPANYDETYGCWFPPYREIRFNSALKHDDGLLSSSYARKNSIGFEEGRDLLRRDISRLKESLEMDGEATIGNLGILRKTSDSLMFQPLRTSEDRNKIMGYLPVKISLLESSLKKDSTLNIENGETKTDEERKEPSRVRTFNTSKNYYIAINKIFARSAACVLVAAIIILSFIHPGIDNNVIDQANVLPVETIIRENITPRTPSEPQNIEKEDTQESSAAAFSNENETVESAFELIVATFTTEREAQTYISTKGKTGFMLRVLPSAKRYRVSAAGSDNKEELMSLMITPEFKSHFTESWIWGVKSKAN